MANIIDYLSLTGLTNYDGKIKAFINEKIAAVNETVTAGDEKSFKYVNLAGGTLKFYTVNPVLEDTPAAFEVQLPEQDLSDLMKLVKEATAGNIAVFDENGQVKDGGLAVTDIATKNDVNTAKAEVTKSVNELKTYVGTIPEGYEVQNIVSYINKKAEETLGSATGGSSESAASVKAALDTYKSENDAKVEANTKAAQAAQSTADEVKAKADETEANLKTETDERKAADDAQVARITTLEGQIVGLSGAMHFKGVEESVPEEVSDFSDGDVIIVGNKEYVFNNGAFVELGDVTAVSEAITAITGRVDTTESDIDKLEETHATDIQTLTAKDTEIAGNVTALQEDVAELKDNQYVEITKEQIDNLFKAVE